MGACGAVLDARLVAAVSETRNRYEVSTWVQADQPPAPIVRADTNLPTLADIALRGAAHTGHARQDDDALIVAKAHLVVSVGYVLAAAMTIAGLLILAALAGLFGESAWRYIAIWVGGVGVAALLVMFANRRQQHHYSAAGIAHHDLDSRERVAKHAINVHARLLLARWKAEDDHD